MANAPFPIPAAVGRRRGGIPLLRDRFRIVTTSLPGYGGTKERRTTTDTAIDREAEIVEAVVRHAGDAAQLVGHSFGGQVCLAVALRRIAPLLSLTVIEPTAVNLLRRAVSCCFTNKSLRCVTHIF